MKIRYIHQVSQVSHCVKLVKLPWTHEGSPLLTEYEIVMYQWHLWNLFSNPIFYRAKLALTHLQMCQGEFFNSSRRFYQNIKDFSKVSSFILKKFSQGLWIIIYSKILDCQVQSLQREWQFYNKSCVKCAIPHANCANPHTLSLPQNQAFYW